MSSGPDIYLDHAAATPLDPRVADAMRPYLTDRFYNPSAPYRAARDERDALDAARSTLARCIGARPACITLTAGATEANNLAFAAATGHVVTCAVEHESILALARARSAACGPGAPSSHEVPYGPGAPSATIVGVDSRGLVDPERVREAITDETSLVSISLANGEIGSVQPIREISTVVRDERHRRLAAGERLPIWLHTDATQAAQTLSVNVASLGVDMMTLSAGKIGGPKQVGLLWAAPDVELRPLILGGGQERGLRSGTENVAGAVGFAEALRLATENRQTESRRLAGLRDELETRIRREFSWAVVLGPSKSALRLASLLSVSFPGLEARRLVLLLDEAGLMVGTGAACAASKMRISHAMEALGIADEVAAGSLRMTLGRTTTADDISRAADIIACTVRSECARCGMHMDRDDMHAPRAGEGA